MTGKRRSAAAVVAAALAVLALVAGAATPAAAVTYSELDEPELSASVQGTNVVSAGETARLDVTVQNTGTRVTEQNNGIDRLSKVVSTHSVRPGAALATRATVTADGAPVTVKTGTQGVGTLGTGDRRTVPFVVEVDENAEPGTYRLPVEFSYRHVQAIGIDGEDYFVTRDTETVTGYVTVRVEPSVRLGVVSTESEGLYENADGRVTVTVRNEGSETATNAELRTVARGSLTPRTNGASLGTLAPGETATATFRVGVGDVESTGQYGISFQLRYEDANGVVSETAVRTGSVRVGTGPEFDVTARTESLYVDSTGAVVLTVTNTGDRPATDARASLGKTGSFVPLTSSASLGTLAPGESATARFRIEVSDRALAGSYPLPVTVTHDDRYGEPVASDTYTVSTDVGPETTVRTGGSPAIAAGSTDTVEFTVTNTGEETMRDAVVRINTDSPFETDDDTAYVGTLKPGESRTVTFTVSAAGAATAKLYTVDTTVKYDNAFGDRVVTEVEPTSVRVTEREGGFVAGILNALGL
ncbi:MAG: NEW3 domain-containing protein [Haloferacaceae archaeon]